MKSIIATGILLTAGSAAMAGPYANVESNFGLTGSNYNGAVTDVHVGYEGEGWYVQAGPALIQADGEDGEVELSGKAGASYGVSKDLDLYGEVSFITGEEDYGYGAKVGAKYSF